MNKNWTEFTLTCYNMKHERRFISIKKVYNNNALYMKSPTCVQSDLMLNRKAARFTFFPLLTEKMISISDQHLKIGWWQPFPVTAQQCLYLAGVKVDF